MTTSMSHHHAYVGYRSGHIMQIDCETGQVGSIYGGGLGKSNGEDSAIHRLTLHPSVPLVIAACHDGTGTTFLN